LKSKRRRSGTSATDTGGAVGGTPRIAIVGRPNVGKSTLFNRLAGWKKAITLDVPGVTRDPISETVQWDDTVLTLIDTGGLGGEAEIALAGPVHRHTLKAVTDADALVVLLDARAGLSPLDADTVEIVSRSRKPALYVANKAESAVEEAAALEFCRLGIDAPLTISAEHAHGISDLKQAIAALAASAAASRRPSSSAAEGRHATRDATAQGAGKAERGDSDEATLCRVALVGRPNVGKSSLLNSVAKRELALVDDRPGTTRDVVDTVVERRGRRYLLLDTAGLRRPSKVARGIEKISARRSLDAVERADVVVLLIEPGEAMTDQDARIARTAWDQGKGLCIVVNKVDLLDGSAAREAIRREIGDHYPTLSEAPVAFMSVRNGEGINGCFRLIDRVFAACAHEMSTSALNRLLEDVAARKQPPVISGGRLRLLYATQIGTRPPTIKIFANRTRVPTHYRRFLERCLREAEPFEGTPLRLLFTRRASH